ncbi:MAG: 5-formyltetrahydrofolate cyclo-ligase [Woeseiaceae bacterium]|nr:5-formyltetrahydrofolate cyclo-ligase [Woeseiaceae bacterium]
MQKQRSRSLAARRGLTASERRNASRTICKRVIESREFSSCRLLGIYLPMRDEVDTREIIRRAWRANKRVFVPILRGSAQMLFCEIESNTDLEQNRLGIWEPSRGRLIDAQRLDLVIAPTVAFDADNNRIGMGAGFFDRCFAFLRHRRHWLKPKLVGVAYRCQKVEKIKPNAWDIRLYRMITE